MELHVALVESFEEGCVLSVFLHKVGHQHDIMEADPRQFSKGVPDRQPKLVAIMPQSFDLGRSSERVHEIVRNIHEGAGKSGLQSQLLQGHATLEAQASLQLNLI